MQTLCLAKCSQAIRLQGFFKLKYLKNYMRYQVDFLHVFRYHVGLSYCIHFLHVVKHS